MEVKARKRIMLVEDDADTSVALSMLLRMEGFDVSVAANGSQGYQCSLANPPDMVVTDLSMPVMTGFDLIMAFNQSATLREIPVIAVSAMDRTQLQTAAKLGAAAVYQKPLDFDGFLSTVSRMLAPNDSSQPSGTSSPTSRRGPSQRGGKGYA